MKHIKESFTLPKSFSSWMVAVVLVLLCLQGCKKYYDPPFVFEEQNVIVKKKRNVLLIVVDGATGTDIKAIAPPKITAMLNNSKYTWNGFSDYLINDGGTWKNIMTGVGLGKHGIVDSTFEAPVGGDGHEHDATAAWPTFIERLQASGKMKRAVAITPWTALKNKLFIYADQPISVNNDLQVRDSALVKLKSGNNDLVIVNFNEVSKAGLNYGFAPEVSQYREAVMKTDTYIGELLDAVKSRKSYSSEEWLVIVTSNHGGTGKGYGEESNRNRERGVFTLYYNADFKSQEVIPPSIIDGVKFSANAIIARLPGVDAAKYNLGLTGEFTIEFRLRIHAFGTQNSTIFFKTAIPANSTPGWWFIHNGSNGTWRFVIRRASGGTAKTLTTADLGAAAPPKMDIDKWYTLTAKIYNQTGKRFMVIYQDGVKASNPMDITGEDVTSPADLFAGYKAGFGNNTNQTVSNIRFWNTALPDSKILEDACAEGVSPSDPYYSNLIGYWPCNDGLSHFTNYSPQSVGKNLELEGAYSWEALPKPTCGPAVPLLPGQFVISNADIAKQILYWYGAKIEDSWKMDGKVFLSNYESEFIK